ncbi:DNA helicase RecQ [Litorimonas sp. WD9-15]|uniref:DNA helicase RecQ n=1 Tax=Litorimonas sp. WD9-15 TaxID=3418716 RepID=UPI003CFE21A7
MTQSAWLAVIREPRQMTAMTSPHTVLEQQFGHKAFRPGQADIIDHIMSGRNVLAVMPTGAGKSLCYQVPSQLLDRPTVVVSPLVALMDNQAAGLRANGVPVACIHSGQSREENVAQWRDIASGRAKLVYLSPERLMTGRMLAAMKALDPALFVVDEAHCVSKWGPAFRPEYADLTRLRDMFPEARIAAFTATADDATRKDIAQRLFAGQGEVIVHGFDRPNLSLNVAPLTNRTQQLLGWMENQRGNSGIVYCLSRKNTEKYAQVLCDAGYKALPYHAGLSADVRFENQERFLAEPATIIVATIAFGMGIDKSDVRFVYHLNLPSSLEAYYQEIGRAGRDGAESETAMVYGLDDIRMRRQFISDDGSDADHQLREHKRLDALLGYCEAAQCRRQILMSYFGEDAPVCGNCDVCENPPVLIDVTDTATALFGAIEETGQRFGATHVIAVARGEETPRILQFNHDKVPSFGAADLPKPYFQGLLRQAVALQYIHVDMENYGRLELLPKALEVLQGGEAFMCKDPTVKKTKTKTTTRQRQIKSASLSSDDTDLLTRLKSLRMDFARELGKPAFVVFSDATLMDMVMKRPQTRDGMMDVSGVGPSKYERFGEAFLAEIAG